MHWLRCFPIILEIILTIHHAGAAAVLGQRLSFVAQSTCTYDYEVAVHTARGTRSTVSEGFHLHALVSRKNLFTVLLLLRKLGFSRIKSSVCAKGRAHSKNQRSVKPRSFVYAELLMLAHRRDRAFKLHDFRSLHNPPVVLYCTV